MRRYGLVITGPNASGKTTALRTALGDWDEDARVVRLHSDTTKHFDRIEEAWRSDAAVVAIEGIDRTARRVAEVITAFPNERTLEVVIASQAPEVMLAHLRARCAKVGKEFNEAYWSGDKLRYEGQRRYMGLRDRLYRNARLVDVDAEYAAWTPLIAEWRSSVRQALPDRPKEDVDDGFRLS